MTLSDIATVRDSRKSDFPPVVPRELWEREYTLVHSIPSSLREEPAKALVLFSELLRFNGPARVLDVGCGNGRNAIYLAARGCDVSAVDSSEAAIKQAESRVKANGLEDRVHVIRHAIDGTLPFESESFDAILDCYTFCHFLADEAADSFWRNMSRLTRVGGSVLSLVFSPDDAYYSQYRVDTSPIVCDPTNGICKRLYTEDEIKRSLGRWFTMRYFTKFEFEDIVHGKPYLRVILAAVLQK